MKTMTGHELTAIDWENCFISDFTGDGPGVEIPDDSEPYCATIPDGMTAREMCVAFARTYDFNGEENCDITCSCEEYRDDQDSWILENAFGFRVVQYASPAEFRGEAGFAIFG